MRAIFYAEWKCNKNPAARKSVLRTATVKATVVFRSKSRLTAYLSSRKGLTTNVPLIGIEVNPNGPGTKTQRLMTLTRQPVVRPFWMGAHEQDVAVLINGPVRRRICVGKTLPEKLERPLGAPARTPALTPLRNRRRHYHYNHASMRWSAVLSYQMLNSRKLGQIQCGCTTWFLASSFCEMRDPERRRLSLRLRFTPRLLIEQLFLFES